MSLTGLHQLLPEKSGHDGDECVGALGSLPLLSASFVVSSFMAGETRANSSARDGERRRAATRTSAALCPSVLCCTRFKTSSHCLCVCVIILRSSASFLLLFPSSPITLPRPSLLVSPCARVWLSHHHHHRKGSLWRGGSSRETATTRTHTHTHVCSLVVPPPVLLCFSVARLFISRLTFFLRQPHAASAATIRKTKRARKA